MAAYIAPLPAEAAPASFTIGWLAAPPLSPPPLSVSPQQVVPPERDLVSYLIGYRAANAEERVSNRATAPGGQVMFSHAALGVAVLPVAEDAGTFTTPAKYGPAPLFLSAQPVPERPHPSPLPLPLVLALVLVPSGLVLLQALFGGRRLSYRPLRRLDRR